MNWVLLFVWEFNLNIIVPSDLLDSGTFGAHDRAMEFLGYGTLYGHLGFQVFDDLLDALSGCLHTFLGTLESHFVTLCARPWEANHHPTVLLGDFPQDLASSNNKMTVVLGVHQHVVFYHIIQVLNQGLLSQ